MRLTQEHLKILKSAYDDEERHFSELIARGKIYLSITSVYVGFITFKFTEIGTVVNDSIFSFALVSMAAASVLVSLILTIMALGMYAYEVPFEIGAAAKAAAGHSSIDEFYEDVIADLAVAAERNSVVNERRAKFLAWSSYFLAAAVCSHLLALIYYVYRQHWK
jgi:hypothetical protein